MPRRTAARLDGMVLDRIAAMDPSGMYDTVVSNGITMCGYGPTAVAMLFSEGAEAVGIRHTDSYDSLGMDPDAVVGYASAVFSI